MDIDLDVSDSAASLAPPPAGIHHDNNRHTVQFYDDNAFLVDCLSRSFATALAGGGSVVVVATKSHRDALARQLVTQGTDLDLAARRGRYLALDAAEALGRITPKGQLSPDRFIDLVGPTIDHATAASGPQARVAIFGELVALLCANGEHQTAVLLEGLWNHLAQTHDFALHCAYPMRVFGRESDGAALGQICAAHSGVTPAESYTTLIDEADQRRTIALLQQKAHALAMEVEARKRTQQVLERRESELRAALEARDEFLADAAHELKTPLTSLRAFTQLLLRDARARRPTAPERLKVALEAIEQQTGRLAQAVTTLLDSAVKSNADGDTSPTSDRRR